MVILHLSDTHTLHHRLRDLPEADVVVHSGDACMAGTEAEMFDFLNWFMDLPYRYKIFVAGNHDNCLYGRYIEGLDSNCFILNNSGVEIEGVKLYGLPMFMEDILTGDEERHIAIIPNDTDILVSHQPPYGILDYSDGTHFGSVPLLERVKEIKPKLHLFGHIHNEYGMMRIGETVFANSCVVNDDYALAREGRLIEIKQKRSQ